MPRALATVFLLLGFVVATPTAAIGAEPTSSYGSPPPKPEPPKPEPPKPESSKPPEATTPSPPPEKHQKKKEGTTPSKEVEKPELPEQGVAPVGHQAPAPKANSLPLTGFDLRWELGIGILLIAVGCALVSAQRRHRPTRHR